jgi:bifunctional aspartokinase / homoserine dehydrogenase 1
VLIDQGQAVRALRAVHARFYLATLPLAVGLVGPGLIGSTFLEQLQQQAVVRADSPAVDRALVPLSQHGVTEMRTLSMVVE